jgi:hypothetical protein
MNPASGGEREKEAGVRHDVLLIFSRTRAAKAIGAFPFWILDFGFWIKSGEAEMGLKIEDCRWRMESREAAMEFLILDFGFAIEDWKL